MSVLDLLGAPVRWWNRFFFDEIDARRLAALRIATGVVTFLTLMGLAGDCVFLLSDGGWLPSARSILVNQRWTLLHTITTPNAVRLFMAASLLCSVAVTVGYYSRISTIALFICVSSIQNRDPLICYGGDDVVRLLLFYLCLGPTGRVWSVDALLARQEQCVLAGDVRPWDVARVRRALTAHATTPAWPIRLIQIQIAMAYLITGWVKFHGVAWRDGTVLAEVLCNPEFSKLDFTPFAKYETARFLTWFAAMVTLYWELGFAFMVPFRQTRALALILGIVVHGGIIVFMRVHWFGYIMIASYLCYVPGESLRRWWIAARRRVQRFRRRRRAERIARRRALLEAVAATKGTVAVVPPGDPAAPDRAPSQTTEGQVPV